MIIGAVGNMRSGKTLACVAWISFFGELLHLPIWSNTFLSYKYNHFDNWRELKNIRNAIILYDEIDTAIDSRNFKSDDQRDFTHWFKQMGKNGVNMFYTTQRLHMVEKRVREQTDYIISCQKNWLTGELTEHWYDTQAGMENGIYIRTYRLSRPQPIYSMYDSFKTIKTTLKK